MRVRTYDEIHPDDSFRLSFLAFGEAWDEAKVRRVRSSDRRYLEEFALYAEERGRVLAQVVPLRFQVRLRSGVEEVGGLAGVCSHPAVWGRGYARRLMDAAHDRFRALDLRISTLTTSRNIRGYLSKYRVLLRQGKVVGYLRTRPDEGMTMEEVVVPGPRDFRAAVALMESRHRRGMVTVNWITAADDVTRFRSLGYSVDGPIPDATMALSLTKEVRATDLRRLFGGTSGRFVQYPTDDF